MLPPASATPAGSVPPAAPTTKSEGGANGNDGDDAARANHTDKPSCVGIPNAADSTPE